MTDNPGPDEGTAERANLKLAEFALWNLPTEPLSLDDVRALTRPVLHELERLRAELAKAEILTGVLEGQLSALRDERVPEATGGPSLFEVDPELIELLRNAGRKWGPLGVAQVAEKLAAPGPRPGPTPSGHAPEQGERRCVCGEHSIPGVLPVACGIAYGGTWHRTDGPCYSLDRSDLEPVPVELAPVSASLDPVREILARLVELDAAAQGSLTTFHTIQADARALLGGDQ